MVEGFSLELQEYCSYMTMIKCKYAYKCERIVENLNKRKSKN